MKRQAMKHVNAKRRARLYERNFSGGVGHDSYIRSLPCCLCPKGKQTTPTQAAHAKARGLGGCGGDYTKLVPLCFWHHNEHGRVGNAGIFGAYAVDLLALAAKLAGARAAPPCDVGPTT